MVLARSRSPLRSVLLGATALGLAGLAPEAAPAQEPVTPVAGRPFGGGSGTPSTQTGTGLASPGLSLPPGLGGNAGPAPIPTAARPGQAPTTGAGRRPGLREARARRARLPTAAPVQTRFRSTLIAPEVAANVQPIQTGLPDPAPLAVPVRKRPVADDPYAPIGIRVGNINLLPVLEESIGYDTNPNRTERNTRGSFVSQTSGELGIQSDWSRHELSGFLRGGYNEYPGNPGANRPEGAGRLGLRLDATRDTQFDVEAHYQVDTQRPGSPDLNAVVRARPIVYTEGASAGVTQRFNRVIASLRGTIDRADYEDADLGNGTILDQRDRALTSYGLRGRLGYELTPGLVPFVETIVDTRRYDLRVDSAGFARSSDGVSGRLGTTFELTRLLTGEVSGGVQNRSYQDARLANLTSPVGSLALAYALSPITTVRANATASVDETTVPGANGIRSLKGSVEVAHALRRNLTVTAGLTAGDFSYQGVSINEESLGAFLRADYRLNRFLTVRASYTYDSIRSSVAGSSYATNVFLLGLRLNP